MLEVFLSRLVKDRLRRGEALRQTECGPECAADDSRQAGSVLCINGWQESIRDRLAD